MSKHRHRRENICPRNTAAVLERMFIACHDTNPFMPVGSYNRTLPVSDNYNSCNHCYDDRHQCSCRDCRLKSERKRCQHCGR